MNKNINIYSSIRDDKLISIFIEPFDITLRIFDIIFLSDSEQEIIKSNRLVQSNEYITEEDLKSNINSFNKRIKYNNKDYYCIYEKKSNLDKNIWKPYKEFYFIINVNDFGADAACFIDKYAETYLSKMGHGTFNKRFKIFNGSTLIRFLSLPNTDLTTCPKVVDPMFPLICNQTFDSNIEYTNPDNYKEIVDTWKNYWTPSIQLICDDTIQSNQYLTFSIKAFHKDNQICTDEVQYYIEPIQGYTPNKEITMINGEGTGKIYALGLNPGDKLRFKINSKYWTNLAEKVLTVI